VGEVLADLRARRVVILPRVVPGEAVLVDEVGDVYPHVRVAVHAPGPADLVAALEDLIRDAEPLELDAHQDAVEAGPDDGDREAVRQLRLAVGPRRGARQLVEAEALLPAEEGAASSTAAGRTEPDPVSVEATFPPPGIHRQASP
jgi:hypothetical protein